MTQEYEIPAIVEDALHAATSAIQFCNSMMHEPLRELAKYLWEKTASAPAEGADIEVIGKTDIMRGHDASEGNGKLYYVPQAARESLECDYAVMPEKDDQAALGYVQLMRVVAEPVTVDMELLKFSGNPNDVLLELLESAMATIVDTLRKMDAATVVATIPEMSVSMGDQPQKLVVHVYCLAGGIQAR